MSTPEPFGVKAERPAARGLFQALFDDAAVFPPGLVPLPAAVTDHVARQSSSDADLVGPLLVPVADAIDLVDLPYPPLVAELGAGLGAELESDLAGRLEVALVSRPGADLSPVGEAMSRLATNPAVIVVGIEIGWSAHWSEAPGWGADVTGARSRDAQGVGIPLSIEVPRGAELQDALSDLQAHADDCLPVRAKFRTGSTPEQPAPTSTELAVFIRSCVDHDLSFKLTGGLHHAISQTGTDLDQGQLGFLNVIAATRWALAHGAEVPEMDSLLLQRDPEPILDIITRMSEADASVVRAFFASYGCCAVMDPIGDLTALHLIKETTP